MLLFVLSARQKEQHASADFKTELKDLYKEKGLRAMVVIAWHRCLVCLR